jgi:hypothetical protein
VDVISAQDLSDSAPDLLGDEYPAWRERWTERAAGSCYWIGRPEHLCFPWAEPDFTLWNPVTGGEELGWRVVPPSAALKNRYSGPGAGDRVQVQPPSSGPIRVADRTFHGEIDGEVVAANLDTAQVVTLPSLAGEIWRAVSGSGGADQAVAALTARYDADPDIVRGDVDATVRELVRRGLLVDDGEGAHAR